MKNTSVSKNILLSVGDGPEGIEIYTDENEGIVDWSASFPAVYLLATLDGVMVKLGPFTLRSIYKQLKTQLAQR